MNSDIRVATTFFMHRKTKKLKRKIGDHGLICLLQLWTRVAVEKPCGYLDGWSVEDIETEAGFDGDEGFFVKSLIEVGFLDKKSKNYNLHNWSKRQPWVSDSDNRSNKARLIKMARDYKKIYCDLVKKGYTGISLEEYKKITSSERKSNATLTKRQRSVNATLTKRQRSDYMTLTPYLTLPFPTLLKETSQRKDNSELLSVPEAEKANLDLPPGLMHTKAIDPDTGEVVLL